MLELKYTVGQREMSAVEIRAYFRSGPFRSDRLKHSLWFGVFGMAGVFFLPRLTDDSYAPWWVYPAVFPLGFLLGYWTFRDTVASGVVGRIRKAMKKEEPCEVRIRIQEDKFHIFCREVESAIPLKDLTWVGRDGAYLDLCFEKKIYLSIPLAVFEAEGAGEGSLENRMEAFVRALGDYEIRDLAKDRSLPAIPDQAMLRDSIQRSMVPWFLLALLCTLAGLVLLISQSFSGPGTSGVLNPLGYAAMGLIVLGLAVGIGLLAKRP